MSPSHRHLLFGLVALQNDFISRRQLVEAFGSWLADRNQALDDILQKQGALSAETAGLLNVLVDQHIAVHQGNVEVSLGTISSVADVRAELEKLQDTELNASLVHLRVNEVTATASYQPATGLSGRFQIRRPLDQGGLGIVSVALDGDLNREVALKQIRDDKARDPAYQQKFLLEAEVTGGLEHPGIVPVYALGSDDTGRPYYAMRLIRGDNLKVHIQRFHESNPGQNSPYDSSELRKLLRRFLDICEAIDYAHARGVLHRDLKPGNIMLGRYGETLVVDWGLAKPRGTTEWAARPNSDLGNGTAEMDSEPPLIPSGSGVDLTAEGSMIGTLAYAPPEQVDGKTSQVDERSDVYGLGAILYELLTGRPPIQGQTYGEMISKVKNGDIRTPRSLNSSVPLSLDAIAMKALSRLQSGRYATAGQLRSDVESWLDDLPIVAVQEPFVERARRWARRHPTFVTTSALALVMGLLVLSGYSVLSRQNQAVLAVKNAELFQSNSEAIEARNMAEANAQAAREQSDLALDTMTFVVTELQTALEGVPREAELRRRLLNTSIPRLKSLGEKYLGEKSVEGRTAEALLYLGNLMVQLGGNDTQGPTQPNQNQSTVGDELSSGLLMALQYFEQAVMIAEEQLESDTKNEAHLLVYIESLDRRAFALNQLGRLTEAIDVQRQVVELADRTFPGNREAANEVRLRSRAHRTLGLLLMKGGDTASAGVAFGQSLQVLRDNFADKTNDPELLREYAGAERNIAKWVTATGSLDEALMHYEASLAALQRFQKEFENTAAIQLEWMETLAGAGETCMRQGKLMEARGYFQQLETAAELVSESEPNNLLIQGYLPFAYERIAFLEMISGNTEEGYGKFKVGLEVSRRIAQLDSLNAELQEDLVISLNQMCDIAERMGKTQEAIKYGEEALSLARRLSSLDEENNQAKRRVWVASYQLGVVHESSGDYEQAEQLLTDAIQLAEQRANKDHSDIQAQRDLATNGLQLGTLYYRQADYSKALEQLEKAKLIANELSSGEAPDSKDRRDLMIILGRLADVHSKESRLDQAIEMHRQSIAIVEALVNASPGDAIAKRNMGVGLYKLAVTLMDAKRLSEALDAMEQSHKVAQSLIDSGQLLVEANNDLERTSSGLEEIRELIKEQQAGDDASSDN